VPSIELIILAAVAVFVISRLYAVLGTKTGTEQPARRYNKEAVARRPEPKDEEAQVEGEERPKIRAAFTGPAAAGLESIASADPQFNPDDFTKGARRAYELIVNAFADGDRTALKTLVDDDVFEAYSQAIADREKAGTEAMRLVRLKSARIAEAGLDASQLARVSVSFESELSDGDALRTAREIWTFKRSLRSQDPNWLLDEVATAS
jgi:predicted lipid-binding transport protein (Tim44 family)